MMEYDFCMVCNRKCSKKTINKINKCNDCCSLENLNRIRRSAKNKELFHEQWKNDYLEDFYSFIKKSDFSNVWIYRALLSFKHILSVNLTQYYLESDLDILYEKECFYRSAKTLEIIKIFLFSKKSLYFDVQLLTWTNTDFRKSYFYQDSILDYYFDKKCCNDCGIKISGKNHNFCNSCIERKSYVNFLNEISNNDLFFSEEIEMLYQAYINFLLHGKKSFKHIHYISEISLQFFLYFDKEVKSKKKISNFDKHLRNLINEKVLFESFCDIDISNYNNAKRKYLKTSIYHSIGYFEKEKFIKKLDFNVDIKILDNTIFIEKKLNDDLSQVFEKIDTLPKGFRNLLNEYLKNKILKKTILKEKNAVKELKSNSIKSDISSITNFVRWIIEEKNIFDWTMVSQDSVNEYLLTIENQIYRDIQKRKLYNLFEFGEKYRMIIKNPIMDFKSRENYVRNRVFTRKSHKKMYELINITSISFPMESLLLQMCYFQVLTSKQIKEIKIEDIDIFNKKILINGRAPIYMDDLFIFCLENYLKIVENERRQYKIDNLFYTLNKGRVSDINNVKISKIVQKNSGFTPFEIRRAGLQYCSEKFGPQFLHDCFGISLSHCKRFGEITDWTIEEIVLDELNNV